MDEDAPAAALTSEVLNGVNVDNDLVRGWRSFTPFTTQRFGSSVILGLLLYNLPASAGELSASESMVPSLPCSRTAGRQR